MTVFLLSTLYHALFPKFICMQLLVCEFLLFLLVFRMVVSCVAFLGLQCQSATNWTAP